MSVGSGQDKNQKNPEIKFEILVKKNLPCVFLETKQTIEQGIAEAGTSTRFYGNMGVSDPGLGIMSALAPRPWSLQPRI